MAWSQVFSLVRSIVAGALLESNKATLALLAGTFVGENALLRFYVLHCVFIPVIVTILIAVHFWRIRKDGGISGPL